MQTYGFGNQRSGVFARLQVRLWVMRTSSAVIHPSFITHFIKVARPIWWRTFQTAPTGGAERRDRCQEPRGDDGGRKEAGPTGRWEICLFFWPLPVSLGPERSILKRGSTDPWRWPLSPEMCHHRADLFEEEEIKGLLKFVPWWAKLKPSGEQEGEAGEFKSFCHSCENFVPRIHPVFVCL